MSDRGQRLQLLRANLSLLLVGIVNVVIMFRHLVHCLTPLNPMYVVIDPHFTPTVSRSVTAKSARHLIGKSLRCVSRVSRGKAFLRCT